MSEIEAKVDQAALSLAITEEKWRKLPVKEALEICQAAKSRFVTGDPRVWWIALSQPAERHSYPKGDGYQFVHLYVPEDEERCWFIPETDDEGELPVYDVCVAELRRVLGECSYFEYYLVSKRLEWLIVDNEHDELLVVNAGP